MKKTFAIVIALALVCLTLSSISRPAKADINSIEWLNPLWEDVEGADITYLSGSTWKLKIDVDNHETNGTHNMNVRIYRISVCFDYNKFYNTTVDVTLNYDKSYIFIVEGVADASALSSLFIHTYKIYIEYEFTYQKTGSSVTEKKTWVYTPPSSIDSFAVITQEHYDAKNTKDKYSNFYSSVSSYCDNYAQSLILLVQAQQEADVADGYYDQGDYANALSHYNTAWSYLNQSFAIYTTYEMEYDELDLNETRAELDHLLAEIEAIKANATATLAEGEAIKTLANGQSQSFIINAVGFVFFGIGFIIIGVATVLWAKKPKPA